MLVSMTHALLVIDVQESFRQGPLWPAISNPGIASDVARIVDGARANGDLVVWVLHCEPGSGTPFDPANGHVRYLDPLKPQAGEPELTKTSHNAFTTTNLQQPDRAPGRPGEPDGRAAARGPAHTAGQRGHRAD
jgi:nicotinamidase-related amidase